MLRKEKTTSASAKPPMTDSVNSGVKDNMMLSFFLAKTLKKNPQHKRTMRYCLLDMGFNFEEACTDIDKYGPRVEIGDLADFINASQLEDEIDSLQDLPKNKHVASVDIQIEVSIFLFEDINNIVTIKSLKLGKIGIYM
ncbi:uncharacterized protein LOC128195723 isoform X2 [Vigna angularis]|uniref:uncharacterized protein LOC128195723 isoform X2 n=1 Tax=Phaseolus angularis TaxID=3914 RepID=UPI0022B3E62D|nr:uncharacterized protein LOC128195723 isoform X2 [Vigna angularis]